MLQSESEMEVTIIDTVDPSKISSDLVTIQQQVSDKPAHQPNQLFNANNSVRSFYERSQSNFSSANSNQSQPQQKKSVAIVITGAALVTKELAAYSRNTQN